VDELRIRNVEDEECQQCNTRLGWFEKHKSLISSYLERPDAREI